MSGAGRAMAYRNTRHHDTYTHTPYLLYPDSTAGLLVGTRLISLFTTSSAMRVPEGIGKRRRNGEGNVSEFVCVCAEIRRTRFGWV